MKNRLESAALPLAGLLLAVALGACGQFVEAGAASGVVEAEAEAEADAAPAPAGAAVDDGVEPQPIADDESPPTTLAPAEAELMSALGGIPVDSGRLDPAELRRRLLTPAEEDAP